MESLQELRRQLDQVDNQIAGLFEKRMAICEKVGEYKIKAGKDVLDRQREEEKLRDMASKVSSEYNKKAIQELYRLLMSMSRELQYQKVMEAKGEEHENK